MSSDSDDDFGSIGFMFDTATSKVVKKVEISPSLTVSVRCIDDKPGALQSGQFLWPGASVLGEHLESHASALFPSPLSSPESPAQILELGAGCGLVGLVCAHLNSRGAFLPNACFDTIVFTDHDPGALALVQEAVALLPEACAASTRFVAEHLEWGEISGFSTHPQHQRRYGLIVASDVFYSDTVVNPLLLTVKNLLLNPQSVFLMMTSIEEPPEIQSATEKSCQLLNLKHTHSILAQIKSRIFRLHTFSLDLN